MFSAAVFYFMPFQPGSPSDFPTPSKDAERPKTAAQPGEVWQTARFDIALDAPRVMAVVNLTPDSFSDGSADAVRTALQRCEAALQDGADILDIGAESTRPGAVPLSWAQEWARLGPLLAQAVRLGLPISVDTYHAETMRRALNLGADIVNDVWALRQPGALDAVAAHSRCGVCLMHMHGEPATMQVQPMQDDPAPEGNSPSGTRVSRAGSATQQVKAFLSERLLTLQANGIMLERVVLDYGVGFGKTTAQNLALLREQGELLALGRPLLAGWSRKSALMRVLGQDPAAAHNGQRLLPSVAAALLAVERGARVVRVHDVAATRAALRVWQAAS